MALYRINEKDWENHAKKKSYSNARKRAETDIAELQKIGSFMGNSKSFNSKLEGKTKKVVW